MRVVGTGNNLSLQLRVQICTNMCFMFLVKTLSLVTTLIASKLLLFLVLNIRRVVNVVFSLFDDYPASESRRWVIIEEKKNTKLKLRCQDLDIFHKKTL